MSCMRAKPRRRATRTVPRRDERNVAARHRFEEGVAIERKRQPLRAAVLPTFRRPAQVQPGAEIVAMAEDDAAFRFLAGAIDRFAQLPHHRRIEAVAFVRTIEPDQGDLALELVGDRLFFAHELLLVSTGKSSPSRAIMLLWKRYADRPALAA